MHFILQTPSSPTKSGGSPQSYTTLLVEIDFVLDYTKPMSIISLFRQDNQHLL